MKTEQDLNERCGTMLPPKYGRVCDERLGVHGAVTGACPNPNWEERGEPLYLETTFTSTPAPAYDWRLREMLRF